MVLESIVVPSSWEKHPKRMLLIGFLYVVVGLILGYYVFGSDASLSAIFLTTIPLVVIMYKAIDFEEHKHFVNDKQYFLVRGHITILSFFLNLFLGMVFAYAFLYNVLPEEISDSIFKYQMNILDSVSEAKYQGATIAQTRDLSRIISNNIRVLIFCIFFSFLYGAGAIYILTLNASVIGVAIGSLMKDGLLIMEKFGSNNHLHNIIVVVPLGLTYLVHGIPEILSYFMGALAGGIISVAVVCHHNQCDKFQQIIYDSLDLIFFSFVLLIFSAVIEVYITPNLI